MAVEKRNSSGVKRYNWVSERITNKRNILRRSGEGEKGRCLPWSKEEEEAYMFWMKQVPVPIPLTCISCKLLEHILASNMMQLLESNNILFEFQHGFRANRPCESQIIFRIHQLTNNKDKHIQTDLMIMNFAKAFDTVLHKRILYKLKYYSMSQQAIN
jgi:hypothetical protein